MFSRSITLAKIIADTTKHCQNDNVQIGYKLLVFIMISQEGDFNFAAYMAMILIILKMPLH